MSRTKETARPDIQNIKTAVQTISTCSASTVSALEALLTGSQDCVVQKENVRAKESKLLSVPTTTATRRRGATTTSIAATVTPAKQTSLALTAREKYILATEVANVTLKSLSNALKTASSQPSSNSPKPAIDDVQSTKTRKIQAQTTKHAPRPLQERSASQTTNSPQKPPAPRRSLSSSSCQIGGANGGLHATAECARTAFAYLRSPEAAKIAGKDAPALQLENGVLALIGKLVAHNMDHMAVKELRILKRRLDTYLEKGEAGTKKPPGNSRARPVGASTASEAPSLALLLDFGDVDRSSPALSLITTHQTYTLRMIAKTRRPKLIQETWNVLKLSNPSSPANLIESLSAIGIPESKISRQLEALSQVVLSLCPSVSSSDDAPSDPENGQVSPDVVLSLQYLAFKIRRKWWTLANHQANLEKELLEPFSRCVLAFARRTKVGSMKAFKIVEQLYKDLLGSEFDSISKSNSKSPSAAAISKCLGSLAQSAGMTEDAIHWLGVPDDTERSRPPAQLAAHSVRRLALELSAFLKGSTGANLEEVIRSGLDSLSGDLSGSSADVDALFLEVNTLRRVVSRVISAQLQTPKNDSLSLLMQQQAPSFISATIRFTRLYLATRPPEEAEARAVKRFEQRVVAVSKNAKSILDSAGLVSKLSTTAEQAASYWATLDQLLQDCKGICQLEESSKNEDGISDAMHQPFVRLSNAYWAAHDRLKAAEPAKTWWLTAMERSAELLQERSPPEQQTGLLLMKLERLAEASENAGSVSRSRNAYTACIHHLIGSGILDEAVGLASKCSVPRVFEAQEQVATLGRILKSYHRSFLYHGKQSQDENAFFDDDSQSAAARGLILEWQLHLYMKAIARNRSWKFDAVSTIQDILRHLLNIYTVETFPVRRRRVQVALLDLAQENAAIFDESLLDQQKQENIANPAETQDNGLLQYGSHLHALWKLKVTLREPSPRVEHVQECLSAWRDLIRECQTWKELSKRIDDIDSWLADLQTLTEYLAAKGDEYVSIQVLHLIVDVLMLRKDKDPSQLVEATSKLALQLLRLGYSQEAGQNLEKARKSISHSLTCTEAKLQWHLAYAEYLLEINNTAECEATLDLAASTAKTDDQFMSMKEPSTTLSVRTRFNRFVADACYVHSLLSKAIGQYKDAARYAKQSVALNRRIWAALESRMSAKMATAPESMDVGNGSSSKIDFNPLASMRSEKGTPLVMSVTHESLDTPDFWPLVPRLYSALMQQSEVFACQGLLQEAIYVAEQAGKIASSTRSSSLFDHNYSQQAKYWAESARLDKADTALANIDHKDPRAHLATFYVYSAQAKVHHLRGDLVSELAVLKRAKTLIQALGVHAYVGNVQRATPSIDDLTKQVSKISLADSQPKPRQATRATRGRKPAVKAATVPVARRTTKAVAKAAEVQTISQPTGAAEYPCLLKCETFIRLQEALNHVKQEKLPAALKLIEQAKAQSQDGGADILLLWTTYKTLFAQSMEELASNFTLNTLPDSTIAFPAMVKKERQLSEVAASKPVVTTTKAGTKGSKSKKPTQQDFFAALHDIREYLFQLHLKAGRSGSNTEFNKASSALSEITILMSANLQGEVRSLLHPLYAAFMSEISKHRTAHLTKGFIESEQESLSREECLAWPVRRKSTHGQLAAVENFQRDYIDIIPEHWTAVSLYLNEGRDELCVARYDAGHTPFILRLPMRRHASRDMDEEDFSFDDGKRDFEEIIELSDFSTRSAKDMTSREARLQWWNEREALDAKLHTLLVNIENLWLGGFKGVFSQHQQQPSLLACFRKALDKILDRHLPSRKGKAQQKKPTLDQRVLELFIGLGDATDEELDLDEALQDLIYFVVDILQFNGEHNAYDEIDFDAIVIETTDALRDYHSASSGGKSEITNHTILILDKNLHGFPWESLPCLQSLSISRLPSLAALRERILASKLQAIDLNMPQGHYVSAASGGTSILNPSGDLTHTLKTLKPRLADLQGSWKQIINRAPSEKEFETALQDEELVLYFGHGSGAQFVRSKSVRRLYNGNTEQETDDGRKPGCATTFLFGCSSVHLTENGDFEPSGMLASYLVAGAPAVVGMLWDVTDKDCDRFAVKAGETWGLWREMPEEDTKASRSAKTPARKGKGKGKVAMMVDEVETARAGAGSGAAGKGRGRRGEDEDGRDGLGRDGSEERRRGVGLDEAVRVGREACVLRYLNGAAAVVYGIPCYLR